MAEAQVLDPESINLELFSHLHSLYGQLVEAAYRRKIKDAKKLIQALEDERWRYQDLPEKLDGAKRKGGEGIGLSKAELERVVRWKITHGTNRPFLPGLIRKNDPTLVQSATKTSFDQYHTQSTTTAPSSASTTRKSTPKTTLPANVSDAISTLTTLTGVGPATASLLLSISFPDTIPFFSDELFIWLCSSTTDHQPDGKGSKPNHKMKYDIKEYALLFTQVETLRQRLNQERSLITKRDEAMEQVVKAVDVEKVAFVLGHLEILPEDGRKVLDKIVERTRVTRRGGEESELGGGEDVEHELPRKAAGSKRGQPAAALDKDGQEEIKLKGGKNKRVKK